MDFLILATERYGRSMTTVQGAISRLSAAGSDLSVTGATGAMGGLLGARWNESQAEELTRGPLRAIAAMTKTAGQSVDQAMSGIVSSMANGSAGAIASAIPYIEQKMQMQWTSMADATNPLKWPLFQQGLLNVLRQEGPLLQARYEEFKLTLRYARAQMDAASQNLRLEFGKALEPMLIRLTHAVTAVLEMATAFVHAHPGVVRLGVALGATAAGLASITLAVIGANAAWAKLARTEVMMERALGGRALTRGNRNAAIRAATREIERWRGTITSALLRGTVLLGVFTLAIRTNFMGMADVFKRWGNSWRLIIEGVSTGLKTLNGDTIRISERLRDELEANGLLGFVKGLIIGFIQLKAAAKGFATGAYYAFYPLMLVMRGLVWVVEIVSKAFVSLSEIFGSGSQSMQDATTQAEYLGRAIGFVFGAWATGVALTGKLSVLPMVTALRDMWKALMAFNVASMTTFALWGTIAILVSQIVAGILKVAAAIMAIMKIRGGKRLDDFASSFFLPSMLGFEAKGGPGTDFSYDTDGPTVTGSPAASVQTAPMTAYDSANTQFINGIKNMFKMPPREDRPITVGVSLDSRVLTDTVKQNEAARQLLRTGITAPNGVQ
jgi:hypothetical protein